MLLDFRCLLYPVIVSVVYLENSYSKFLPAPTAPCVNRAVETKVVIGTRAWPTPAHTLDFRGPICLRRVGVLHSTTNTVHYHAFGDAIKCQAHLPRQNGINQPPLILDQVFPYRRSDNLNHKKHLYQAGNDCGMFWR